MVIFLLSCFLNVSYASNFPEDVPDPAAVKAFEKFWSTFELQKKAKTNSGIKEYEKAVNQSNAAFEKEQLSISKEQIVHLRRSADKYKNHIKSEPYAENRPFVMLNLAQILKELSQFELASNESDANATRQEALALLQEIETNFPTFVNRDDVFYLHATILESLGQPDEAEKIWRVLARDKSETLYAVYGLMALGDFAFEKKDPGKALEYYEKALSTLAKIDTQRKDIETVKLQYRIAWAAYKLTNHDRAITAATYLLSPGTALKTAEQRDKVRLDATDLIGDSLYEKNDVVYAKTLLQRTEYSNDAGTIGLRLMKRYFETGIFKECVEVGKILVELSPMSKEYPSILYLGASASSQLKKTKDRVDFLERLALLLPPKSLWQTKYKNEFEDAASMKANGKAAAEFVSAYHYDLGLASGSEKSFQAAQTFYEILLQNEPNSDESNTWRLRRSNCYFFLGDLTAAFDGYKDLIENHKVDNVSLEVAMYQIVLTSEKIWRKSFDDAVQKAQDPLKSEEVSIALKQLEQRVDHFAERFPGQTRSVDLLLVGASANRDQEKFDRAMKFWQRTLISNPNSGQRSIAIRGIMFALMKSKNANEVLKVAIKFLKLEDVKSLDQNLAMELRGVLSAATQDEANRLNQNGKVADAGRLQVSVAQEFPEIPNWNQIYRDGAYALAIASEWQAAQKACEDYLKFKNTTNRGDMVYLLARSHEYQLRLSVAAQTYYNLAVDYPKHSRAELALERAEKLAIAEGDLILAAQAASIIASRTPENQAKLAAYDRAIEDYLEKGNLKEAKVIAQKRLQASTANYEKFKSQIVLSRIQYRSGDEQNAIDELEITEKRIQERSASLGDFYAGLTAESNLLLGLDAKKRFEDFSLVERSGSMESKMREKSKLFEELTTRFDKSARANVPQFSARARFEAGDSASKFADEIAAVPTREEASMTLKSQTRYSQNIQRLRDISKKYHSTNVLVRNKQPDVYQRNEWVQKSSNQLLGFSKANSGKDGQGSLPPVLSQSYPNQWSAP